MHIPYGESRALARRGQRKHKMCLRGLHPLVGDTVYVAPDGRRRCLPCYRAYRRDWRLRNASVRTGIAQSDLAALLVELREAAKCLCGGPHCGPNAQKWYVTVYPNLREYVA